ncbi:hypothetical protein WS71_29445 [Burkholderia mayonis]|uniref:Uncharacterized protein n=1 Tax=Burkholderia mayonis TaxID=1385591 RepID=A0A1B4G5L4_9BURK|nr:hypothetical protein WS71_29445 [Burkholderia mayonis]KVE46194.1 hypothetical protein WS71_20615 [Burkholderia mayonis]
MSAGGCREESSAAAGHSLLAVARMHRMCDAGRTQCKEKKTEPAESIRTGVSRPAVVTTMKPARIGRGGARPLQAFLA